jgi:hypothetical protein
MRQELIDFRKEIAALEVEQKNTKEQRKTVRFTGERTMSPFEAWGHAKWNKDKLRAMYAAYGLMRGKGFYVTEKGAKPLDSQAYYELYGCSLKKEFEGKHPLVTYLDEINEYLEKYGYRMPYEEETKKNWRGEEYKVKNFDIEHCEEIVRIGE